MVTAVWLIGFGWWSLHCQLPVSGNEWGDRAAGMFAPVAFLWLVLGYFQQGEGLRDNVKALHLQEEALRLQADELKQSVQQQTQLVAQAIRQGDLMEKSQAIAIRTQVVSHQPRPLGFVPTHIDPNTRSFNIGIQNIGVDCYEAHFEVLGQFNEAAGRIEAAAEFADWKSRAMHDIRVFLHGVPPLSLTLLVHYRDAIYVQQTLTFNLDLPSWPVHGVHLRVTQRQMTFNLPPLVLTTAGDSDEDGAA